MRAAPKRIQQESSSPGIAPAPGRPAGAVATALSSLPMVSTDVPVQDDIAEQTVLQAEPEPTTAVEEVETPEVEQEEAVEEALDAEAEAMEEEEEAIDASQSAVEEAIEATDIAQQH